MKLITRKQSQSLNLTRYFTGLACKHGHIAERATNTGVCLECRVMHNSKRVFTDEQREQNKQNSKQYYHNNKEENNIKCKIYQDANKESINKRRLEYRNSNKEKINARNKKYYKDNQERIKIKTGEYHEKNKEQRLIASKKYYEDNKEKCIADNVAWRKEWRKTPIGKTTEFIRDSLRRIVNNLKYDKNIHSLSEIGYTPLQLKQHLENQFDMFMTWDNYGLWHIDHIEPLVNIVRDNEGIEQGQLLKIVNALDNLQPLWARDNLVKGSKI